MCAFQDETDYPANAPVVPLLNSYIHDWFKSAKKLVSEAVMCSLAVNSFSGQETTIKYI